MRKFPYEKLLGPAKERLIGTLYIDEVSAAVDEIFVVSAVPGGMSAVHAMLDNSETEDISEVIDFLITAGTGKSDKEFLKGLLLADDLRMCLYRSLIIPKDVDLRLASAYPDIYVFSEKPDASYINLDRSYAVIRQRDPVTMVCRLPGLHIFAEAYADNIRKVAAHPRRKNKDLGVN